MSCLEPEHLKWPSSKAAGHVSPPFLLSFTDVFSTWLSIVFPVVFLTCLLTVLGMCALCKLPSLVPPQQHTEVQLNLP